MTDVRSYAPEVQTGADPKFYGNMLRFATEKEAEAFASDLMGRWLLVVAYRAAESFDKPTHRWDFEWNRAVRLIDEP
jgi:hypothetical protein